MMLVLFQMLNRKEPSIHFESITKVRPLPLHTRIRLPSQWAMLNDEWWWMMNDEWWMKNDEWWMMNDEWLSIPWTTNDEWWIKNYQWWMMLVLFQMLNWKEPSIPFESITKVRPRFFDCHKGYLRRACHVTKGKTEFIPTMPKRLNWSTLQKERLPSSQPCPTDTELVHITKGKTLNPSQPT